MNGERQDAFTRQPGEPWAELPTVESAPSVAAETGQVLAVMLVCVALVLGITRIALAVLP